MSGVFSSPAGAREQCPAFSLFFNSAVRLWPLRSSGGQAEHSAAAELRAAPPEGRRGTAPPPGHHGYPLPRRAAQLSEAVAIFLDVFTAADSEKRFVIEVSIPTALLF